ncbi:MAG: hypothetical protein Q9223_004609 [Gallowayella weberi]
MRRQERFLWLFARWLATAVISALFIATAAQLALALTNLTFSVDDGTNYNDTYVNHGMVSVPDLKCYHRQDGTRDCPGDTVPIQTLAHAYGEMNLAAEWRTYDQLDEVLRSQHDYRYYWRQTPNRRQFAYRFNEFNPTDNQSAYPYFTRRLITVESLGCTTFNNITKDDKVPQNFTYSNGSFTGSVKIPPAFLGREGTTYIYSGFHNPSKAGSPTVVCGPRCVIMLAYKNPSGLTKEKEAFYQCPIDVSNVQNADPDQPAHLVPHSVARVAAASIALQGRWAGSRADPLPKDEDQKNFQQYFFYANG